MDKLPSFIISIILAIYFIYSMYIIQIELTNIKLVLSWGYLSILGFVGWDTILKNLNKKTEE